jgi:putative ABC transport system substrate-binding protein
MRRRDFISLLGGVMTAWPIAARTQQPGIPVVGFLYSGDPTADADLTAAFRNGLREAGCIEGQNVAIEYRWAHNDNGRLPELMNELTGRRVAVIAAMGNPATRVAAARTKTIPIVFTVGSDPVQDGIVASMSRPGTNLTGITTLNGLIGTKWLGLFHDLLPNATRFVLLSDHEEFSIAESVKPAAAAKGWQIETLEATTAEEIDAAFASLVQHRADALMIAPGALFRQRLLKLATLATRHGIPAIYPIPQFAEVGGLMSYGTSYVDTFRQAGIYASRIVKGAKPADLPVLQPTKFEFVINLSTAKALDLRFPPGLLAIADRVIE